MLLQEVNAEAFNILQNDFGVTIAGFEDAMTKLKKEEKKTDELTEAVYAAEKDLNAFRSHLQRLTPEERQKVSNILQFSMMLFQAQTAQALRVLADEYKMYPSLEMSEWANDMLEMILSREKELQAIGCIREITLNDGLTAALAKRWDVFERYAQRMAPNLRQLLANGLYLMLKPNDLLAEAAPALEYLEKQFGVKPSVPDSAIETMKQQIANQSSTSTSTSTSPSTPTPTPTSTSPSPTISTSSTATTPLTASSGATDGIIKSGTMKKLGGFVKNWKSRYFKLYSNKLEYYAPSGLKGTIMLSTVSEIRRTENASKKPSTSLDQKNGLQLVTPKRVYVFYCNSNAEREEWFAALEQQRSKTKQ
eukprot:TRINITY_DN3719_c0_g2_i1.p1 TRINITY_DN3719_c0_g2~~TRINITY_DN3719_c0_g2_i1.p1  ORF type:complete len:364 (+),score=97.16 TRINITY_DN3719_c0_g2_i1:46-1137(+)